MILRVVPRLACRGRAGGAKQTADRAGRNRPTDGGRSAPRLRSGGCRIRQQPGATSPGGLGARGLSWAVGIPPHTESLHHLVCLPFPGANRGKPRLHAVPSETARDAADVMVECSRRRVTRRQGTKGPLAARFSAVRVRSADGPRHGHLPGEEVLLIGAMARQRGNANTISAIFPPAPSCGVWPRPSRRAGCVSRDINNSSRNSASTASKSDFGPV